MQPEFAENHESSACIIPGDKDLHNGSWTLLERVTGIKVASQCNILTLKGIVKKYSYMHSCREQDETIDATKYKAGASSIA